jgi:hypothetical protein
LAKRHIANHRHYYNHEFHLLVLPFAPLYSDASPQVAGNQDSAKFSFFATEAARREY